jgi:hypothetical protein
MFCKNKDFKGVCLLKLSSNFDVQIQGRIQKIEVRGGATLFEAKGLGATLSPPVGPGAEAPEFYRFYRL